MNGPSKGHLLPYLRKGICHKICFCARAGHRSVPAGPLSAFPRGQHPRPQKPAKKIAHIYFVCFSPPRSLLMIGPELHRLQIYRSEMTLPGFSRDTWGRALPRRGCAPWPRGLAMCAPRIASLAISFSNVFILWALAVLCGM